MNSHINIIIPVYNEPSNFPILWAKLCSQLRTDFTAHVVYDFDEDDTRPVIERLIARGEKRVHLVKNDLRAGVVGAIQTGFNQVDEGPILVVMADLSDDLSQVDSMLALYDQGYHIVVGSRYMKGGRLEGGPRFKQFLSRMSGLTLCWFRGIPTHDATNAFKIYDTDMLRSLTLESDRGFELSLEITVKAFLAGYHIAEIPARWTDRSRGESRFQLWSWLPHYLRWYFFAFQHRREPLRVRGIKRQAVRENGQ